MKQGCWRPEGTGGGARELLLSRNRVSVSDDGNRYNVGNVLNAILKNG